MSRPGGPACEVKPDSGENGLSQSAPGGTGADRTVTASLPDTTKTIRERAKPSK